MKRLITPQKYWSTEKFFVINIIILVIGVAISLFSNTGYINTLSFYSISKIYNVFDLLIRNTLLISLLFLSVYIPAKIINKKIDWKDCFNLAVYSKAPMFLCMFLYYMMNVVLKGFFNQFISSYQWIIPYSILEFSQIGLSLIILFLGFKTVLNTNKAVHFLLLAISFFTFFIVSMYLLKSINL